jgi:hypothetical protein
MPTVDAPSSSLSGPAAAPRPTTKLAPYLLVEPSVSGRVVVDVDPGHDLSAARLLRAGAARMSACGIEDLGALEQASVDVLLWLGEGQVRPGVDVEALFAAAARVVRPTGFFAIRVPSVALAGEARLDSARAHELLLERFATVQAVVERPFAGVAYSVSGTDEVAVNEELAAADDPPSHHVFFATTADGRTWELAESLLVPVAIAADEASGARAELARREARVVELEQLRDELCAERDQLREAIMLTEDREDRRDQALRALRRESERLLEALSAQASTVELAQLERDRADRRAASVEGELAGALAQLKRREVEVQTLERELERLRAKLGRR